MSNRVTTRNSRVLEAALALAQERGWRCFSRQDVADRAGISAGSVSHAFGTMDDLHDWVMSVAVARRLAPIVASGLVLRHHAAVGAPQDLKALALATLVR